MIVFNRALLTLLLVQFSAALANPVTYTYVYDNLNRLDSAADSEGSQFSYTYDMVHNRTQHIDIVGPTPPVAIPDQFTTSANTLSISAPGVLANDYDLNSDAMTAILDQNPISGILSLSPDGAFTYTREMGFTGQTTFSYMADANSELSDPAQVIINVLPLDTDGDGIPDETDNCPTVPNPGQSDNDGDHHGDICDSDDDNDGTADDEDAFPLDPTETTDTDNDGIGDNADTDDDNDLVLDGADNCPLVSNVDQIDSDGDGIGNVCEILLKVHDHNGDGTTDLYWRHTNGLNAIWEMNGLNVSSGYFSNTPDSDWQIMALGDFDGDNKSDVFWRHSSGLNVIWLLDGINVLASGNIPTVSGSDWQTVGVGDFNGDSKSDILWRNSNGLLSVWEMDGSMVVRSYNLAIVSDSNWVISGIGDFDHDGMYDLLWRNQSVGSNILWLLDGNNASIKQSANLYTVPDLNWNVVGIGDFTGDGRSDLLWRHTNGSNSLWEMNGFSVTGRVMQSVTDSSWNIEKLGDFNGDGKTDIFWRNTSGANTVWFMNGTTIESSGSIPSVSTTGGWSLQNPLP